ncbi:hypothetical protein [Saccharothrix algeriensis]|uniref:Uncharacterized protein n=1 Tax=Saccharothrix algeriensis TaxID=173560 RepID=A0A8T8I071_9PSEU|nr:hypothetical protein [Saccharothrix algeriensis]MBM7809867.1 hypothetical protein [Saccharothrix algeriensis]QTR04126.1 hypothetical protein J7S33_03870 [Saccharothrix algeriensis]
MTAIPGGQHRSTLLLICDDCGRAFDGAEPVQGWRRLWERATAAGWRGFDRWLGPHRCAECEG